MQRSVRTLRMSVPGLVLGFACSSPAPVRVVPADGNSRDSAQAVGPEWQGSSTLPIPMQFPTATQLPTGRVLVAGGDVFGVGLWVEYDPMTGTFARSGAMHHARLRHTATLLADGRVLVTGGREVAAGTDQGAPTTATELFDPMTGVWTDGPPLHQARWKHTATRLRSGEVLVVGGAGDTAVLDTAELFDPSSGVFWPLAPLDIPRAEHDATLLTNGDVLITGGSKTSTASLRFHSTAKSFVASAEMARVRLNHTATLLANGRVLVAGGNDGVSDTFTAELYDPVADTFTLASGMSVRRSQHRANLLPSGRVLLTGGLSAGEPVGLTEVYDVAGDRFEQAGEARRPRAAHATLVLPSGKVLVTGGVTDEGPSVSTELFDPQGVETLSLGAMFNPRYGPGAALLPSGEVLLSGGVFADGGQPAAPAELCVPGSWECRRAATPLYGNPFATVTPLVSGDVVFTGGWRGKGQVATNSVEIYHHATGEFSSPTSLLEPRHGHTAALLAGDKVLISGGWNGVTVTSTASVFDPASGSLSATSSMARPRIGHSATTLGDGRVVIAGGWDDTGSVEIYDPDEGTFLPAGALPTARGNHVAVRLDDRRVLFIGGLDPDGTPIGTIDRYDASTQAAETIGSLVHARWNHTATRLPSGKVLVAGGVGGSSENADQIAEAELVDPETGESSIAGELTTLRAGHAAVILGDGSTLLAGGWSSLPNWTASLEVYDPLVGTFVSTTRLPVRAQHRQATQSLPSGALLLAGGRPDGTRASVVSPDHGTLTATSGLHHPRSNASTTLLDDTRVLVVGGEDGGVSVASTEVFSVVDNEFTEAGTLADARQLHTATRMPSGEVLVAGGVGDQYQTLDSAETFDPATGVFRVVGPMVSPRAEHGAVLLRSGKVLLTGGRIVGGATQATAEVYDPATESFAPANITSLGGRVLAKPTASGDPLIAADKSAYLVNWDTGAPLFFGDTPASPFAVLLGIHGESTLCGDQRCARLDLAIGAAWRDIPTGVNPSWSAAVELPSGDSLVFGKNQQEDDVALMLRRRPSGARAPALLGAVAVIDESGAQLELTGARFEASPAPTADAVPAASPPLAVFRAESHGPIVLPVRSWTDTRVVAIVPPSVYHGPGWVHVVVDGVASAGQFILLPAASNGAPCAYAAQCTSNHCIDEVCCDQSCGGSCQTCLGAHQAGDARDGTCGHVAAGEDPRDVCERMPEDSCQQDGACNGHGACALHADGTECRVDGRCAAGVCLGCNESDDSVLAADSVIPCAPFLCREGACLQSCTSQLDCMPGHVCGADGQCKRMNPAAPTADAGACTLSTPGRYPSPWLSVIAVALGLGLRRTRRHRER